MIGGCFSYVDVASRYLFLSLPVAGGPQMKELKRKQRIDTNIVDI